MSERLKDLLAEYGGTALAVYLTIFAATLFGFAAAIRSGFEIEGADETAGLWFAAWVATKATQPLRIGATLPLTPLVAGVLRRFRPPVATSGRVGDAAHELAPTPDETDPSAAESSTRA